MKNNTVRKLICDLISGMSEFENLRVGVSTFGDTRL